MGLIFDTSAWIELFLGNSEKAEDALKNDKIYTSIATFSEVVNWCFKNEKEKCIDEYIKAIRNASSILNIDDNIALTSGKINFERKKIVKNWGMMDSIILSTAIFYNLRILTKDSHFKDLENADMIS